MKVSETFYRFFWLKFQRCCCVTGAYDENLKRYDCCLWTEDYTGKISRVFKIFSRFSTKKMLKRTRSRERFPIGEWAHKAKYKQLEAVEASKSLENIERET